MSFSDLGLSRPILDAIASKGYSTPSPIQAQAIPAILEGHDLMAAAQTGTGKTAGFTLPLLQRLSEGQPAKGNQVRALILTPTRELAAQVGDSVSAYSINLKLRSAVVFGGVKINPQLRNLRGGVDILVATPGRLLDLYQQNAIRFNTLEVLVLDEADRMLDMGFIHDIKRILALLPKQRQNLLFSATFSDQIRTLAKSIVTEPVEISVTPVNSTATTVSQKIYPVDKNQKANLLTTLISDNQWQQVLVFSRTKHGANRLARQLEKAEISAAAIHGNKSQGARTKALADFRSGQVRVLVATDIAARGLDINQLPHVVNFDLPNVAEDYVHRIGRTGRAGASGHAVSLVCADEFEHLTAIEQLTGKIIEREIIDGFAPVHVLPESDLSRKPAKKKTSKAKAKPARNQGQNKGHEDGQRSAANARGHKPPGKNKGHRVRKQSTEGQASSAGSSNSGHKTGGNTGNTASETAARPARRSRNAQAGQISKPAQNTSRDSNANTRQGTGHNSNRTQAPAANKPVRRTRKRPAPKPAAA